MPSDPYSRLHFISKYVPQCLDPYVLKYKSIPASVIIQEPSLRAPTPADPSANQDGT